MVRCMARMKYAALGVPALRFSFSGNGNSEGSFEESCITKEIGDLGAVLDALPGRQVLYVGHSMGGAVGVIRATRDERIRVQSSLSSLRRQQFLPAGRSLRRAER